MELLALSLLHPTLRRSHLLLELPLRPEDGLAMVIAGHCAGR